MTSRAELIRQEIQKKNRRKYQPNWFYKTHEEAREDLKFQKRINPSTYKWLMSKDIKVGGKRTPAKEVLKSQIRRKAQDNPLSSLGVPSLKDLMRM